MEAEAADVQVRKISRGKEENQAFDFNDPPILVLKADSTLSNGIPIRRVSSSSNEEQGRKLETPQFRFHFTKGKMMANCIKKVNILLEGNHEILLMDMNSSFEAALEHVQCSICILVESWERFAMVLKSSALYISECLPIT